MNAFCKGCGFCNVPNPSSVMIGSSPTSPKAIEQVLVSFPPTDAAQAPHCPRPQPNFGPFNPRSFRSTYNSGVSGAAVITWDDPFTVSRYVILHPQSWKQSGGRTPSIGIETHSRKLLHIRQAEAVGATASCPAYAGVPILVSSMSPSCPMRGSRTEPQVSIDSAAIGSVRDFRGSTSVNSSMPKLYSSVMPSGSRK